MKETENREKKDNPVYVAAVCVLLFGPLIAGLILLATHHVLAGILAVVIPYACLAILAFLRKHRQKREFYKIRDAHTRFDIVPVGDAETLKALRDDSTLTLYGEPTDRELAG